jgi:hypothetical protein
MAFFPSNTRKGLGFKRDLPNKKDWDFDKLSVASSGLGKVITLRDHAPDVMNQGSTSSCVAQSFACALYILEHAAGLTPDLVSRLYLYWFSRFLHGSQKHDAGTFLRMMAEALRKYGVCDEEFWKFAQFSLSINKRPSVEAMGKGHSRHNGKYVRIFDVGNGRTLALKAALQAGYPICFGTTLADGYQENEGSEIVQLPDFSIEEILGNHGQCIIGYDDAILPGRTLFEIQNSWGDKWRKAGRVYMTDEYIEDEVSSDFQIVYGWKALQEAA